MTKVTLALLLLIIDELSYRCNISVQPNDGTEGNNGIADDKYNQIGYDSRPPSILKGEHVRLPKENDIRY